MNDADADRALDGLERHFIDVASSHDCTRHTEEIAA